ncbi:hypothetical protein [Paraburkholderia tropica]|uniref:hypothetical protein n=1 Tax=Paraburkholderia tropica TaxID=92647 RepID=UPI001CC5FA92|nr:hypothetical protein [Paraburkholderia tropica]
MESLLNQEQAVAMNAAMAYPSRVGGTLEVNLPLESDQSIDLSQWERDRIRLLQQWESEKTQALSLDIKLLKSGKIEVQVVGVDGLSISGLIERHIDINAFATHYGI